MLVIIQYGCWSVSLIIKPKPKTQLQPHQRATKSLATTGEVSANQREEWRYALIRNRIRTLHFARKHRAANMKLQADVIYRWPRGIAYRMCISRIGCVVPYVAGYTSSLISVSETVWVLNICNVRVRMWKAKNKFPNNNKQFGQFADDGQFKSHAHTHFRGIY